MRIGTDSNFIDLQRTSLGDPFSAWKLEGASLGNGRDFTVRHDRLMIDTSTETLDSLDAFSGLERQEVTIPLSEGGWLKVTRDHRGYLDFNYRVVDSRAGAAAEGEIAIDAEFANEVLREFRELVGS